MYIVMYHYIRELKKSRYPDIKGLEYEKFIKQLDFFEQNFNIITMEEVIEAWEKRKLLPKNAMLLTFDDGYIDHYTNVFPVLKQRGIQGSFFVSSKTLCDNTLYDVNKLHFILACSKSEELYEDLLILLNDYRKKYGNKVIPNERELINKYLVANRFDDEKTIFVKRVLQTALPKEIRRVITSELFKQYVQVEEDIFARELYMNREQIRIMKNAGMYIGLHGYDHLWLGNEKKEEMIEDIELALETMDEFIERDNWVLNYPYGSYNQDVVSYVQSRGCKLAMGTKVQCAEVSVHAQYELPRWDCNDFPPVSKQYLEV